MEFDTKILEEKFNSLPEATQIALTSFHTTDKIKAIADRNGLLLDQTSVLFDLTSYVLLGLVPSDQFVKTLTNEAKVKEDISRKIADEINKEVFSAIKTSMRSISESAPRTTNSFSNNRNDLSALERAGGFSIEREDHGHEESPPAPSVDIPRKVAGIDRMNTISSIENPAPSPVVAVPKQPQPIQRPTSPQPTLPPTPPSTPIKNETPPVRKEPLVDRLLRAHVAIPEQKVSIDVPQTPPTTQSPQKSSSDPYREAIN